MIQYALAFCNASHVGKEWKQQKPMYVCEPKASALWLLQGDLELQRAECDVSVGVKPGVRRNGSQSGCY